MKKIIYILIIINFQLFAQKFDYLHLYAGSRIFYANPLTDPLSQRPENIFAGFVPAQVIGVGLYRQLTDRLTAGGSFEVGNSIKTTGNIQTAIYNMNIAALNAQLKLNILNIEYFASPYIIAGVSYSFITFGHGEYIEDLRKNVSDIGNNTESAFVVDEGKIYREASTIAWFVPVYGAHIGMGIDIKVREGWGIFGQYTYNNNFTSNAPLLRKSFGVKQKDNTGKEIPDTETISDLIYHNMTAGVRIFF
ncbi:MAG: hypothetical protein NW207_12575 [Cytophagales bacterium]|nr:hypothetical protein [Cytophagales bacterium]